MGSGKSGRIRCRTDRLSGRSVDRRIGRGDGPATEDRKNTDGRWAKYKVMDNAAFSCCKNGTRHAMPRAFRIRTPAGRTDVIARLATKFNFVRRTYVVAGAAVNGAAWVLTAFRF